MNMQISRSSAQQSAASPQPCPTTGLRSPADVVVLVAIALATIPFLIANVVILLYRQRTYFRVAGGVDLILGSSVSGLIWIASSFVVGEHFYRRSIFEICSLWSFWLHLTFGLCLWLICVAMRLHRMQTLCNGELEKERRSQLWTWAVFIPLFLTPAIIFSVIATIKQISRLPEGHGILRRSGDLMQCLGRNRTSWSLALISICRGLVIADGCRTGPTEFAHSYKRSKSEFYMQSRTTSAHWIVFVDDRFSELERCGTWKNITNDGTLLR